jgi:hypothetical protein
MKSLKIIVLFTLFSYPLCLIAQKKFTNKQIIAFAKVDANNFKLNDKDLKDFRKRRDINAVYFKPDSNSTSNYALINDSTYIKAYTEKAYRKTEKRRTFGHYALIGGIAVVSAFTIVVVALSNATWK